MSSVIERSARVDVYRLADLYGNGAGSTACTAEAGVDLGNVAFVYTGGAVEDEWTLTAHAQVTGNPVHFDAVGTGASPFVINTTYWLIWKHANYFQLASSLANAIAGTPIEGAADSVGTWSLTCGVYDATAPYVDYLCKPPAGETWAIERVFIGIEDGTAAFNADNYGAIDLSSGNGWLMALYNGAAGSIVSYLTGTADDGSAQTGGAVKSNMQLDRLCYDGRESTFGSGNKGYAARWTFGNASNENGWTGAVILNGDDGDALIVRIADDLSGLDAHTFFFHGRKR